jgi:soluble P-type ATPase
VWGLGVELLETKAVHELDDMGIHVALSTADEDDVIANEIDTVGFDNNETSWSGERGCGGSHDD